MLEGLISPNLIDQLSCKIVLNLAVERTCARIPHDDWSIRLGENRPLTGKRVNSLQSDNRGEFGSKDLGTL